MTLSRAKVTNPPIDPFREKIVMSLRQAIGPAVNLLSTDPSQCRRLIVENPVLSLRELEAIKKISEVAVCSKRCDSFAKRARLAYS